MPTCKCKNLHCLFKSLEYAGVPCLPKVPATMKKWCNTDEYEQISVSCIPIIEEKLRCAIDVDDQYVSPMSFSFRVRLTYSKDGHYSFKNNDNYEKHLVKRWTQGKKFCLFHERENHILTYDGDTLVEDETLSADMLNLSDDFIYSLFVPDAKTRLKIVDEDTFEDAMIAYYHDFMADCEALKKLGIDMSINGYRIKDTAIHIFSKYVKAIEFHDMDGVEEAWYLNTKNCGLHYSTPHKGHMKHYDVVSCYPAMMRNMYLWLPTGKPVYKTIEKVEDFVEFGIFRAVISNADRRLFVTNPKNYYTYTDMNDAIKRGYDVQMVIDGKPNHLFYDRPTRVSGWRLFGGFVDQLYSLKDKNKLVKSLLNRLWGALCERITTFSDVLDCNNEDELDNIMLFGEKKDRCKTRINKFKTPYARIGVFLTSFTRRHVANLISDIKEEVYHINTDGFWCSQTRETSDKLGGLKLKLEGNYEVRNIKPPQKTT